MLILEAIDTNYGSDYNQFFFQKIYYFNGKN